MAFSAAWFWLLSKASSWAKWMFTLTLCSGVKIATHSLLVIVFTISCSLCPFIDGLQCLKKFCKEAASCFGQGFPAPATLLMLKKMFLKQVKLRKNGAVQKWLTISIHTFDFSSPRNAVLRAECVVVRGTGCFPLAMLYGLGCGFSYLRLHGIKVWNNCVLPDTTVFCEVSCVWLDKRCLTVNVLKRGKNFWFQFKRKEGGNQVPACVDCR